MEYELFHKWEPIIEKFKSGPNMEIEFRFGRPGAKGFDTNVGKESFDKLFKALLKYEGWERKEHARWEVYYFEGNKRLQIMEDTEERESIIKKRMHVDDFAIPQSPFDVRLAVNQEIPFEYDGETASDQKTKERWSFVRKNLRIDLTKMTGDPDDPDDDKSESYQVELEIIEPEAVKDRDTLFNMVYKIWDVLKCV
jgi:hypothetical protein